MHLTERVLKKGRPEWIGPFSLRFLLLFTSVPEVAGIGHSGLYAKAWQNIFL